jgi:hypothetical protein
MKTIYIPYFDVSIIDTLKTISELNSEKDFNLIY